MIQMLRQTRCGPIGLELGSHWVQMVQLTGDHKSLVEMARWDFPILKDGVASDERAAALVEALGQAREGRKFRGRDVVVCLNSRELFVQNIRVPKGNAADLPKLVQQEAASRLPFPVAEAEIRYLTAGDVRQGDQVKREVILLACHRPVIDQLLSLVDSAGLHATAVEIEPSAILRAYVKQFRRDNDKTQRAMFVRLGSTNTTVVIAQGSEVFFVKYIDVGGDQMDEAVARHLKISVDEASTLRRHNGDRRVDQQDPEVARSVQEATRPVFEKLVGELSLCIRYHSVTFRGQSLSRLVLGGAEAVQSFVDSLALRLDVKCELGDPLRTYETVLPSVRRSQWDVATGLALRGLN